jgi:hypothetical protein
VELIPYKQFAKLRAVQFLPAGESVNECDGYEWMGGFWINEGIRGFTSISRHEDTPDEAGGLEIDFRDLPPAEVKTMLGAIQLPLRPGVSLEEVQAVLGEPERTHVFVADRKSYDFTVGSRDSYYVSVTIHETDGLMHVAVIRKDVLAKCDG